MAGLRKSIDDSKLPTMDEHADAMHPIKNAENVRDVQRRIMGSNKPMPPESFGAKVRRQIGGAKSFGDTVNEGLNMLKRKP